MAVNKNFVVRNGLEVNSNLILADAVANKVGIGSTAPRFELDVAGGIGATTVDTNSIIVSGISTVLQEFNVGLGGTLFTAAVNSVGIGTAIPAYVLDVRSPVSTGQTALYVQGDVRITGDLAVDDITFDQATINNLTVSQGTETQFLVVSGVSTYGGNLDINAAVDITGYTNIDDDVNITGTLNVGGITTITNTTDSTTYNNGALVIDGGLGVEKSVNIGGDLDVTGNVYIGGTTVSLRGTDVFIENKDIVLGYTTTITPNDDTANHAGIAIASTEGSPLVPFSVSGINTLPDTYKQMMWFRSGTLGFSTDMFGFNYGVAIGTTTVADGVRLAVGSNIRITDDTINTVNLNVNGIVTSTSGVATYYGDGQYLNLKGSPYTGIGINTAGGLVGFGVTYLHLYGSGVSTTFYDANSGIATVFFQGGGGGATVSVSTVAPLSPTSGDLWYNNDLARTFIYYDEVTLGIGSTAVWIDAAPFNVGGNYLTKLGDSMLAGLGVTVGTASTPSVYFNGDIQTGFFSPTAGNFNVVSVGSTVLNVNTSGIIVTGITTATDFDSLSDINYKENIVTVNNALLKVEQLRGVKFDWKESGSPSYGVIAQELEQVLPELVHGNDPKTVNYNGIIGVLIEAIKELKAEVEELKSNQN